MITIEQGFNGKNKLLVSDNNYTAVHNPEPAVYLDSKPKDKTLDLIKAPYEDQQIWRVVSLLSKDPNVEEINLWKEINKVLLPEHSSLRKVNSAEELWCYSNEFNLRQKRKNENLEMRQLDYRTRYFTGNQADPRMPEYITALGEQKVSMVVSTSLLSITEADFREEMANKQIMPGLNEFVMATQRDDSEIYPIDYKLMVGGMWVRLGNAIGFEVGFVDDDDRIGRMLAQQLETCVYITVPMDLAKSQYKDDQKAINVTRGDITYGVGLPQLAGYADKFKNGNEYDLYIRSLFNHVSKPTD
jgi:hypothetical protein